MQKQVFFSEIRCNFKENSQIYDFHKKIIAYFKENGDVLKSKWVSSELYAALCELAAACEVKNSQILWPVRTALSGKEVSPGGATELAEILGYDETVRRLEIGLEKLEKESV